MAGEYLKSSVHVHSKLCDGKNTLDELAVTAWRAGLQTLGFSGHSHTPCDIVARGKSDRRTYLQAARLIFLNCLLGTSGQCDESHCRKQHFP